MNKKTATGFALLSLLAVLAAAGSVAYRSLATDAAGRKAAERDFQRLSGLLSSATTAADLADPELRQKLARYYRADAELLLVSVYERGAGLRWRIPASSPYAAPASPGAMPETSYPPRSALLLAAPLAGDPSGRLFVEALYTSLPQETVFAAFRDAALGLAAYLALTAAFALAVILVRSARDRRHGPQTSDAQGTERSSYGEKEARDVVPSESENPMEGGLAPALDDEDFQVPELETGHEPAAAEEVAKPTPTGLYSPLSGLGWESYLADRLDAELARSASFEQDLSLLLYYQEGLAPGSRDYGLVMKAARDFFSFRDLSFEYGPEGFAVILPNIDVDHGIRMAEEFLKKVTFTLREERDPLAYLPVFMGLSSRAGRLVDAARITAEAEAALSKAKEERDSHIIAFRPDPDKYRLFLAARGC